MDPFLGPVAGALLAALGAGAVLGVVRLRRLSLDWWRRRAAASSPPPPSPVPSAPASGGGETVIDAAVAPPVFAALGGTALAAVVVAGLSFVAGAARMSEPAGLAGAGMPATLGAFAARSSSLVGFAVVAVVATVALALATAALDRWLGRRLGRLIARVTRHRRDGVEATHLSVPDLIATARGLLPGAPAPERGEPFGVGLAYVGLFAAAALGVGALFAAAGLGDRRFATGFAAVAALGLLATPVLYAAAAERSRDPLLARLRRDAAVRQLAAAPAWCIAGAVLVAARSPLLPVLVLIVAAVVFAVAVAVALPGAGADPGAWNAPPHGGDRAEPAAAVRALTGIAHYAWLTVAALLPFFLRAEGPGGPWPALGLGAAALVVFLAARAALHRSAGPATPGGGTA